MEYACLAQTRKGGKPVLLPRVVVSGSASQTQLTFTLPLSHLLT